MANFPGSVTTFAARTNGQTIDASHVQTLQDEVNAIEDGYLNGSARLNSSNSTLNNLSVLGGSTLAKLEVSGGSTFVGKQTIASTALIACRVSLSTTATTYPVADNTWTAINWDTEDFDHDGMFSTASNSSRLTVTRDGVYLIGACIQWSVSTAGMRQIRVRRNDTSIITLVRASAAVGGNQCQHLTSIWNLTANDYLTIEVWHNIGSSGSVDRNIVDTFRNSAYVTRVG